MSAVIATAFDTLYTLTVLLLIIAMAVLATLAYADNETFIYIITTGSEGITEFAQNTYTFIKTL